MAMETHIWWLVGGLVAIFYFPIYWVAIIIPIDELIFFRGVAHPPTRWYMNKQFQSRWFTTSFPGQRGPVSRHSIPMAWNAPMWTRSIRSQVAAQQLSAVMHLQIPWNTRVKCGICELIVEFRVFFGPRRAPDWRFFSVNNPYSARVHELSWQLVRTPWV